jgi:CRISPR-associated endonuclease/helicase Cas3
MQRSFPEFFDEATGGREPYPYQRRFAEAGQLQHLLRIPTGAGKTATAVLGWLWRWRSGNPHTPRRLVYCLPMRVLVEQSVREAKQWIEKLKLDIKVHCLMGGVEADKWYLHPEKPAILIGTQDMLLSRALNRGYGASRFHWPIDFGLLNNDSLWVFDEPQLMGAGVSTSAQLAGLRATMGTFGSCPSVWMSATLEPAWLETVDFRGKFPGQPVELGEEDYAPNRPLYRRMTAEKSLAPLGMSLSKEADDKEARAVAGRILEKHREATGGQTLVVLNTVKRATKVYEALTDIRKKYKSDLPKLLLVHSRFRPHEREVLNDQLQQGGVDAADRIIVATQVVEAGVDISARTLVTELAPWASLVQRMGRCNRTGEDGPGRVFWIDLDLDKQAAPYDAPNLQFARALLGKLDAGDVSPMALDQFKRDENITLPFEHAHVIRRRDVVDLFDTSPDLSGNDIDVSRFIRGDDPETDVEVFWRLWDGNLPPTDLARPDRRELCPVPLGNELQDFLRKLHEKKNVFGYVWDHLDEIWRRIDSRQLRPGLTILLSATAGGYSMLGWDTNATSTVELVPARETGPEEGAAGDPESSGPGRPLKIVEHTDNVCREMNCVSEAVQELIDGWSGQLAKAARWHDAGKAHPVFQASIRKANPALANEALWAKSGVPAPLRHSRKCFRHELASALVALQRRLSFEVAYLIAAHHGKVRLSIRSLPGEEPPDNPNTLFAVGVHDGEKLPAVDLGGETCPETELDLSPMRLGGEGSWTARALALRDELGPFRLAYLEALLRASDLRASANERKGTSNA